MSLPFLAKSKSATNTALLLVLAATLYTLSLMYISQSLAVLAFSIFAYCLLQTTTSKQAFYTGALFGLANSFTLHFWMFSVISNYAKGNFFLALVCYIVNALVLSLFFAVPAFIFHRTKQADIKKLAWLFNAALIACLWLLFEALRTALFSAMPWLSYTTGITAASSLYMIQPAAYGGVLLLSFLIFIQSSTIAIVAQKRQWLFLLLPLGLLVTQFVSGYWIFNTIKKETASSTTTISVALILPALSPETVWNNESANGLVTQLFTLNKQAAALHPDLTIWTETVVPWTYAPDDDFIKEITSANTSRHLIGMNSADPHSSDILCNSVYLLDSKTKKEGRYDKQDLLTMVEKPLFDEQGAVILPFMSSNGVAMRSGKNSEPLETPWGNAGIMLCNESTSASLANNITKKGAAFLVNIGNDNWFAGNYIIGQHFYNDRLRAVENRKDIIVNNNLGKAGLIKASGEIAAQFEGNNSSVQLVKVQPNTIPVHAVSTFILIISCLTGVLILTSFIQKFYIT